MDGQSRVSAWGPPFRVTGSWAQRPGAPSTQCRGRFPRELSGSLCSSSLLPGEQLPGVSRADGGAGATGAEAQRRCLPALCMRLACSPPRSPALGRPSPPRRVSGAGPRPPPSLSPVAEAASLLTAPPVLLSSPFIRLNAFAPFSWSLGDRRVRLTCHISREPIGFQ